MRFVTLSRRSRRRRGRPAPPAWWRGRARLAVREAAEAADDVGVDSAHFNAVGVADRAVERDAALLVGEVFRMLERQIEETAHRRVRRGRSRADGAARRPRVPSGSVAKARALAAEHVARKLVEHDQQRQRALAALLPAGERAGGRRLIGRRIAGGSRRRRRRPCRTSRSGPAARQNATRPRRRRRMLVVHSLIAAAGANARDTSVGVERT